MGPYERGCGVTSAEQRGPSVCNVSFNREGKDEMTKASIDLQDLRRRLYVKAKAETSWRFWGLYVHICKLETLHAAYVLAQKNDGAPNHIESESAIAAPLHLVPSREDPAHAFNDVLVDTTVCLAPRPVAKVVGPASQ